MYDLGLIDGQYLLRRNWCVLRLHGDVKKDYLIKSFLQSVMKLKREIGFKRPLLLFDKYPYYKKLEAVEEYKTDRHYTSESDVDDLKKKLESPDLTDEERAELEKQLADTQKDLRDNQEFTRAKYDIVTNGRDIGFPCLMKQGFEADDIAFAMSEKVRELGLTAVLVTTDHDWISFRSKEVDYCTPKMDHRNVDCRALVLLSRELNIPLYEIGVMKEIYDTSHNNVSGYEFSEEVPFKEFCTKLYTKDETLKGYDKISKTYDAMNMRKHLPELDKLLDFGLSYMKVDYTKWAAYTNERGIDISLSKYSEYLGGITGGYLK